jgi:hypothetical protein
MAINPKEYAKFIRIHIDKLIKIVMKDKHYSRERAIKYIIRNKSRI